MSACAALLPSARVGALPKLLLFARPGFTDDLVHTAARRADVELIDIGRLYGGAREFGASPVIPLPRVPVRRDTTLAAAGTAFLFSTGGTADGAEVEVVVGLTRR